MGKKDNSTEETDKEENNRKKGIKRKRDENDRKEERKEEKHEEKKEKKERREPTTVLFVPRTEGGALATLLKKKEKELEMFSTHRVRIIERNGERLEHILTKPDPFGEDKCEKMDCLLCQTNEKEKGTCKKTNVVYKIECRLCRKGGKEGIYWGETARSSQLRGGEHSKEYRNNTEKSHMRQHMKEKHPEEDADKPPKSYSK